MSIYQFSPYRLALLGLVGTASDIAITIYNVLIVKVAIEAPPALRVGFNGLPVPITSQILWLHFVLELAAIPALALLFIALARKLGQPKQGVIIALGIVSMPFIATLWNLGNLGLLFFGRVL